MNAIKTLKKILDIDEKSFQPTQDSITQDNSTDVFAQFLCEYNNFSKEHSDLTDSTQLDGKLKELETKYDRYEDTIQNVIPPLIQFMNHFNEKLSEYTTELNLIRNKSDELKNLSLYNSKKLANISPVVNDLLIPPQVVHEIISGKINSSWIDNINFIKDKQEMYSKYVNLDPNDTSVILPNDFDRLCEVLEVLKTVILERSKKFLVSRIRILRSYNPVPSQKVQNQLLRLKEIFKFIIENNVSLALEIRQAYSYTMKWYYKEYFGRYIRSLTILQFTAIDNQYSLGNLVNITNNNSTSGSIFTSYLSTSYGYSSTVTNDAIKDYFQIKKRLSILTQEDNTVMVSQIAENNKNTKNNFIELGFKNLNLAILDNCTVEFNFLKGFFQITDNVEEINGILEQIFQPTLQHALTYTEQILINSTIFDIFGVLISIRIGQQLQIEATRRGTPVFDNYLNDQSILLWPKFQQLIDWQAESLNTLSATSFNVDNATILSQPHELTIAFTVFLQSLLTLSINDSEDMKLYLKASDSVDEGLDQNEGNLENKFDPRSEPLYQSMIRVRNAYETVMTKFSKMTKSAEKFLSINYLYMYNSLQHQNLSQDNAGSEDKFIDDDKDTSKETPIRQELELHFKNLVEAYNQNT
ncbi:vacuolar protein sorting-associated protein 52 [Monosporozyma unispora]|nr:hypothetical protein C6P44_000708 [Kazachstania unispora]